MDYSDSDNRADAALRKKYGIGLSDYNSMFEQQHGRCALCDRQHKGTRRLNVDHCHKTGRVRGLLCMHCNKGLGWFRDNADALMKAVRYLDPAENVR